VVSGAFKESSYERSQIIPPLLRDTAGQFAVYSNPEDPDDPDSGSSSTTGLDPEPTGGVMPDPESTGIMADPESTGGTAGPPDPASSASGTGLTAICSSGPGPETQQPYAVRS
jgi:hypothetical protein